MKQLFARLRGNIWTLDEVRGRLLRMIVASDIWLFSMITLGRAARNETASSAAWRLEQAGKWQGKFFRPKIDWLLQKLEKDHCYKSWLIEHRVDLWNPPTNPAVRR